MCRTWRSSRSCSRSPAASCTSPIRWSNPTWTCSRRRCKRRPSTWASASTATPTAACSSTRTGKAIGSDMITALLAEDFLKMPGEQRRDDRLRPALQPRRAGYRSRRRRRAEARPRRPRVHQEDDGRDQGGLRRRAVRALLFPRQLFRRLRRHRVRADAVGPERAGQAAQRADRAALQIRQSGEINFQVEDKDGKIRELADAYKKAQIDYLDGITIDLGDWWFNVRKSNTEPLLRLNLEAQNPQMMEEKLREVQKILGEPCARALIDRRVPLKRDAP